MHILRGQKKRKLGAAHGTKKKSRNKDTDLIGTFFCLDLDTHVHNQFIRAEGKGRGVVEAKSKEISKISCPPKKVLKNLCFALSFPFLLPLHSYLPTTYHQQYVCLLPLLPSFPKILCTHLTYSNLLSSLSPFSMYLLNLKGAK